MQWGLVAVLVAAACGDDTTMKPDAFELPEVAKDVDLLFVIDDSPAMAASQGRLAATYPSIVTELRAFRGGLPNLHLGVVTTDLGTTAVDGSIHADVGNCSGIGKAAKFTGGDFLIDVATSGGRMTNYTGTLEDAFTMHATVGASGCEYPQPLEAMRRAIENPGFRRPHAFLMVVIISNSDDCSMTNALLDQPGGTFRCQQYGYVCAVGGSTPSAMAAPGMKSDCDPVEDDVNLSKVSRYVTYLNDKIPQKLLSVMVTPGTSEPMVDANGLVRTACSGTSETIGSGVRLVSLSNRLPSRSTIRTYCADLAEGFGAAGRAFIR